MTRWTYKRVMFEIGDLQEKDFEARLDAVGAEGWELVSTFDRERAGNSKECFFLFKRPLG